MMIRNFKTWSCEIRETALHGHGVRRAFNDMALYVIYLPLSIFLICTFVCLCDAVNAYFVFH